MATTEQIEFMLQKLDKAHPSAFFKRADGVQAGIGAVLRLLGESSRSVTAGEISEALNISTARVAVLIRKMVSKGLVTKEQGLIDGRITIVKLTELGEKTLQEMREEMYHLVGKIIDTVGIERLSEFLEIAEEIKNVTEPQTFRVKKQAVPLRR